MDIRAQQNTKKPYGDGVNAVDGAGGEVWAMAAGDAETVRKWLEGGADVDAKGPDGQPLLVGAVDRGHTEIVAMLLAKGADVKKDCVGYALQRAALRGYKEIIRMLLDSGVDVNGAYCGRTALHLAGCAGQTDMVEMLLDCGVDVNGAYCGCAALHAAVCAGQTDVVEMLLDGGVDVNGAYCGWTALHAAVSERRTDVVEMLLERGADVAAVNRDGYTASELMDEPDRKTVALLRAYEGKRLLAVELDSGSHCRPVRL